MNTYGILNAAKRALTGAAVGARNWFLTKLGDVKVFKWPMFLVYDPDDYQVTGNEIAAVESVLKPGDVLCRGYNHYLDSKFIPQKSGNTWDGKFAGRGWSHGAIYVGNQTVIHAVAEGVEKIHLLDFLKCDRVAVLRPSKGARRACGEAKRCVGLGYDFGFNAGDAVSLYCFELVAVCYPGICFGKFEVSKLFGLLKRDVYLAQSFFDCESMRLLYVHNPASGIMSRRFRWAGKNAKALT